MFPFAALLLLLLGGEVRANDGAGRPMVAQVARGRSISGPNGDLVGTWPQGFTTLAATLEFQGAYLRSTTPRYRRAVPWIETYM